MTLDVSESLLPAEGTDGAGGGRALRSWNLFVDALGAAGSVLIAMLMVLICADVLSRNLYDRPIPTVAEMSAFSVVVIVFLQLASTVRHRRMAQADLFVTVVALDRPRAAAALDALFSVFGVAVCGIIAYATFPSIAKDMEIGEYIGVDGTLTVPTWPFRVLVVAGAGVAALQYLLHVAAGLRRAVGGGRG